MFCDRNSLRECFGAALFQSGGGLGVQYCCLNQFRFQFASRFSFRPSSILYYSSSNRHLPPLPAQSRQVLFLFSKVSFLSVILSHPISSFFLIPPSMVLKRCGAYRLASPGVKEESWSFTQLELSFLFLDGQIARLKILSSNHVLFL